MRGRVVFWLAVVAVLVPAGVLTFGRLVEPWGAFWIKAEAFTPIGIALYGAALLVLLARLLVVRRIASATAGVALVVAAALALHCWWFAPQLVGSNPPPADDAVPLVVMTANLAEGGADGVAIVQHASDEAVGLLVVEEVTAAELADMERAGLDELYPYRAGEPDDFADGTMVFARDELGPAERIPTRHDGWVTTLSTAEGDLVVMAVHPYAPTFPDVWRDDLEVVQASVDRLRPDLVVGDFNATLDHPPLRELADAGYRDAGELANEGWRPTWPSSGKIDVLGVPVPSLVQIDHVLVGPELAALSMRTLVIPDSDHRAVLAEVARK